MLRNPFVKFRSHIDLVQHKKNIENGFNKTNKFLEENGLTFDKTLIEKTFYDLFNDETQYRFNRRNHKIAYLISRFIQVDFLFSEKKMIEKMLEIHNQWFNYLIERIDRHREKFSKDTIISFHSDFPMGDLDIFKNISVRAIYNYSGGELLDHMKNNRIHPLTKLLMFEDYFRFDFAYFLIRCEHLGKEIGKLEGKDYRKKLWNIFQINENNDRAPPDIIKKDLKRLIYIRNAISHPETAGISYNNGKVKIMNYDDSKKEYTYVEELKLIELYEIYYNLTLLDRGFVSAALAVDIFKED
jgi:hypothetical protein